MKLKKKLIITVIILYFHAGCSLLDKVVYHPDINQGNYLTTANVAKIHTGMTKQQIIFILGSSMIQDPFGSNTLYYIFRCVKSRNDFFQQTLILNFNEKDILKHIDNISIINSNKSIK